MSKRTSKPGRLNFGPVKGDAMTGSEVLERIAKRNADGIKATAKFYAKKHK